MAIVSHLKGFFMCYWGRIPTISHDTQFFWEFALKSRVDAIALMTSTEQSQSPNPLSRVDRIDLSGNEFYLSYQL